MINSIVKNWIENTDFDFLKSKINERSLYIWGAYEQAGYIADKCRECGIRVDGFVEANKSIDEYAGISVVKPEKLGMEKDKFFIIPVVSDVDRVLRLMCSAGLIINEDFLVLRYSFSVYYTGGYYEDVYGNRIISYYYNPDKICKITFAGYNNVVKIGKNVLFEDGEIICQCGSEIVIGDECKFKNCKLKCIDGGRIIVGRKCSFGDNCELLSKSWLEMGEKCTMVKDGFISAEYDSPVNIGNDCMFSWPVHVRSNNSHALIDISERQNTSVTKKHYVNIGNHVWIGARSMILFNSDIGSGSVIGASSVVKGEIPQNCVAAGNPAKVLRTNYSWERNSKADFSDYENLKSET